MENSSFFVLFINDVRRRLFQESWPRLIQCLSLLSEEEIWQRPNASCNSVGNLVLHLCGNARQWIVSGLGNAADHRNRDAEFAETGPLPKAQLLTMLDQLQQDVLETLERLKEADLLHPYNIQGFQENGISVLIHVVEHFSYHVGQISYIVKAKLDMDLKYYGGLQLNQHNTPFS